MGRKVINRYLYLVITGSNQNKKSFKYSELLSEWKSNNSEIYDLLKDDTFVSKLGAKLIDILESSTMLEKS